MQDDMFRTSAIRAALRIKVERGTAMDIGMYHSLPERRKLTIEMMVSRLEDPNAKKGKDSFLISVLFYPCDTNIILRGSYNHKCDP